MIEVSVATGIPLEHIAALSWSDLATYLEVLQPPKRKRGR